jgi:hypothetical protein
VKRLLAVNFAVLAIAGAVFAQGSQGRSNPSQQGAMDMTKMGPWTRKVTNEQQIRKEITEFINQEEELMKRRDVNASVQRVDFPAFMVTDDSQGVPHAREFNRSDFTAMMRQMFENMPKDMKVTHKPTITVLSDSLASVTDDFTMTMNKQNLSGKSHAIMVKRDGRWLWKTMAEAGWGDMAASGAYGSDQQQQQQQKGMEHKQQKTQ